MEGLEEAQLAFLDGHAAHRAGGSALSGRRQGARARLAHQNMAARLKPNAAVVVGARDAHFFIRDVVGNCVLNHGAHVR